MPRLVVGRFRVAALLGVSAVLGLAGANCKQPTKFEEVKKYTERFVDLNNYTLQGQERRAFTVQVPGDVTHPAIEGRWSIATSENPVDVFVLQVSGSDTTLLFTSIQGGIGGVGTQRAKEVHVHPTPGTWTVLFVNQALPGLLTATRFSSEIALTYFK